MPLGGRHGGCRSTGIAGDHEPPRIAGVVLVAQRDSRIKDPDLIYPGQELRIPEAEKA
jgi:hypothetical protein